MPNRTTAATATMRPTTRRPSGPKLPEMRSKRTSSLSFSQNADPISTMYSQVTTDSSDVQPIGKLKKYRKTIWMMKQTNMMASRPAITFSARRRIQSTALRTDGFMVFCSPYWDPEAAAARTSIVCRPRICWRQRRGSWTDPRPGNAT